MQSQSQGWPRNIELSIKVFQCAGKHFKIPCRALCNRFMYLKAAAH